MNSVGSNSEGKLNCINAVVITQKCFTVDFLTKKKKINEGEVPQYYVEHSHEPIITPEEFDKVQAEFERRKRISRQYSGKSIYVQVLFINKLLTFAVEHIVLLC